jgi:ketopantoate hydroxymethyltransferase
MDALVFHLLIKLNVRNTVPKAPVNIAEVIQMLPCSAKIPRGAPTAIVLPRMPIFARQMEVAQLMKRAPVKRGF